MTHRILLVDDGSATHQILRVRLEVMGLSVFEAANGEEGLAAIRQNPPDLLFLDVMMPRIDGWEVCSTLKSNPATRNIPIIMLRPLGREIEELHGWESGADEYLVKPIETHQLQHALDTFLPHTKEANHAIAHRRA